MPFDDDAEADSTGFRPPPHPDDRLWRHPSEVGAHPIVPHPAPDRPSCGGPATAHGDRWRRTRRALAVAGGAGAAGIAVAAVVLAAGGRDAGEDVAGRGADRTAAAAPDPADPPALDAARSALAPAVVAVGRAATGRDGPALGSVTGSGLVLRADGVVVTAAAALPPGAEPAVRLAGGSVVAARVVATDPVTGLAVLDVAGDGHAARPLAPGEPGIGEAAVAVDTGGGDVTASPLRDLGPTGTALDGAAVDGEAEPLALGGPVVDAGGGVTGIVTGVERGAPWRVAPAEVVGRVVDDLLATGAAHHVWLGIEGLDAAPVRDAPGTLSATALMPSGVEVASVVPGGPADGGGLQPGDLIVAVDGMPVTQLADLFDDLRGRSPGERLDVTVIRDGGDRTAVAVTLGHAPRAG
ncbi:MAG TPA: S1C family serine protease [Acidimicrobiales bacterium]